MKCTPDDSMKPDLFSEIVLLGSGVLGVPYAIVSAHSRHVQESCYLENAQVRGTSQRDAEWARGGAHLRSGEWTYET